MSEHDRQMRMEAPRGFMETPGSVHKKHECPPDRVAMMERLEEISLNYRTSLAHQRQVIENLDHARKAAEDARTAWQEFGRYLATDYTGDHAVSVRAQELLAQQGIEP